MSGLEGGALEVGKCFVFAITDKIRNYVNYINACEDNIILLVDELESLIAMKSDIHDIVNGMGNSGKLTDKAKLWLARVRDLVNDELMKMLMNKDLRIAKVMLRLMKTDLKKVVEDDNGEIRDVVVKVMKDITKGKRKVGNGELLDEKEKQVVQVLQMVMEETIQDFKNLMQNDEKMAIAAMHLLEDHKDKLDDEVAEIIANARKTSQDAELLSDSHDEESVVNNNDMLVNEKKLMENVKNMLKPIGKFVLSEELLRTLPDNVRLGIEAMGIVIENRRELKAELMDSDHNAATHRYSCCCCCVTSYDYFSDRYDMSVAAEVMLQKIKKMIENKVERQDVSRPTRTAEMEAIQIDSASLKSRIELFEKIVEALKYNDSHAVGVFGMGGSGKTTLAREVANNKAKGIFETTVMVEISESPNIESIQNQIGSALDMSLKDVHGIGEKAKHLNNKLKSEGIKEDNKSNKILIVLDNIWKKIDLAQIGIIPHEYCKLLLTSRETSVCKAMVETEANIFEVGLLNEAEAKDLFQFQVKKKVRSGEYKFVADRLLKKCRGLPLAIVATANSLKGKELPLWRQFAEELERPISCQITGVHYETFSILRTSYDAMASEEKKKFFVLACLSPIGSSISIDNLMRYGIGLDLFQQVNKLSEAIEIARTWAEELVSSSMLLKGESYEYVKIHDVVRESTMSFASKSGLNTDGQMFLVDAIPRWISKETFNKYTGISLLSQANYARLSGVKAHLLQILLLKGEDKNVSFLDPNFFQGMTNLKVLEVSSMNFEKGLPESINKLKDLKTLHLVECILGDIKLIGELDCLLVLNLRKSHLLEGLPDEIGKLSNLRLLDMTDCKECEQPRHSANVITRLSLLEGLYLVGSSLTEWAVRENTSEETGVIGGAAMDELNKLEFLNVVKISMLGQISLPVFPSFVINLDKFQIHVGEKGFDEAKPSEHSLTFSEFDISQELQKKSCLKALLKKVDFLSLSRAKIRNIIPRLDDEGFRNLYYLNLDELSISRICKGNVPSEAFSNLRRLRVAHTDNLEELLPVNLLPLKLTMLYISYCKSLSYIFGANEDNGLSKESDIIELPQLKEFRIDTTNKLKSMVMSTNTHDGGRTSLFNNKVKLPSLEKLTLSKAGSFANVWSMESCLHSFQNLKELNIFNCEIESIGPPSMFISLLQLDWINVQNCQKMQHVVGKECDSHEIPEQVITFPKLRGLTLFNLTGFESFYSGSYKIKFTHLEELYLSGIATFGGYGSSRAFFHQKMEFSCLEKICLFRLSDEVTVLWDFPDIMAEKEDEIRSNQFVELPSLKDVKIDECDAIKFLSAIPLKAPKLQQLWVTKCPEMEWFLSGNSNCNADLELPSLEYVIFKKCPKMKLFSPAVLRAPKFQRLIVNRMHYPIAENEDFNHVLQSANDRS